jgi:hypothetical protein
MLSYRLAVSVILVMPMYAHGQETTLYVPVAFHIVYANTEQNISDEQIRLQLQVINEDFSMTNTDAADTRDEFKNVAANVDIQFYLGDIGGNDAITRTSTAHGPFVNDDLHLTAAGGRDVYLPDRCLNVWVADLGGGIFGYGSAPGSPSFKDGVAVHYEYFGKDISSSSHYKLGRTLTHEIGHWLSLQHPWGTANDCSTDDGLTDTPPQAGPASGCVTNQVSCGGLNMVQNFMNTSYDGCMTLFTRQQKALMRSILKEAHADAYSTIPPVINGVPTKENGMIAYPNPVTSGEFIYIRSNDNSPAEVTLLDMVGKPIYHERSSTIPVSGLSNGIYVLHVRGGETDYLEKIYVKLN